MPPTLVLMLAMLTATSGCSESVEPHSEITSLRVGAIWGLANSQAGPSEAGSSSLAALLVFDPTDLHIVHARLDGTSVRMEIAPHSDASAATLAATFRHRNLLSVEVAENARSLLATFSTHESARTAASLTSGGFEIGPFVQEQAGADSLTLARKTKHPIKEIVIREVSSSDEWRQFLGRRLDVVPTTSFLYRDQFVGLPSVTLKDYPHRHSMGLLFNTKKAYLTDTRTRRSLAGLIDRHALSRALYGTEWHAIDYVGIGELGVADRPSAPLLLAYSNTDADAIRTAAVIRFQLSERSIIVKLVPLDMPGFIAFCSSGQFDMALLPIPTSLRGYNRFLSNQHAEAGNITGYENPKFDAAFDARDYETMNEVLLEDVPATFLYDLKYFAAFRSDLCLDEEPDPFSWRWLAALYPCNQKPTI